MPEDPKHCVWGWGCALGGHPYCFKIARSGNGFE